MILWEMSRGIGWFMNTHWIVRLIFFFHFILLHSIDWMNFHWMIWSHLPLKDITIIVWKFNSQWKWHLIGFPYQSSSRNMHTPLMRSVHIENWIYVRHKRHAWPWQWNQRVVYDWISLHLSCHLNSVIIRAVFRFDNTFQTDTNNMFIVNEMCVYGIQYAHCFFGQFNKWTVEINLRWFSCWFWWFRLLWIPNQVQVLDMLFPLRFFPDFSPIWNGLAEQHSNQMNRIDHQIQDPKMPFDLKTRIICSKCHYIFKDTPFTV